MLPMESLVEALGGRKVLKRRITNIDELRETVKAGLPYASLEALMEKFGFTQKRPPRHCICRLDRIRRWQNFKEPLSEPMNRIEFCGWRGSALKRPLL